MPGNSLLVEVFPVLEEEEEEEEEINCVTVICYSQPDVLKTYGHFECVLSTIRFKNI